MDFFRRVFLPLNREIFPLHWGFSSLTGATVSPGEKFIPPDVLYYNMQSMYQNCEEIFWRSAKNLKSNTNELKLNLTIIYGYNIFHNKNNFC